MTLSHNGKGLNFSCLSRNGQRVFLLVLIACCFLQGESSSSNLEENSAEAEMEETLRSSEESTVDSEEGRTGKDENEVSLNFYLLFSFHSDDIQASQLKP